MKHKNIVKVFWGHEEVINKKLEAYLDNLNLVSNVNYDVEVKVNSPTITSGIYVVLNITCHTIEEPKGLNRVTLPEPIFPPDRDTRHE